MRLGVGSFTFTWAVGVPGHEPRDRMGPLQLLERARDLGVNAVQFCDNLPLTRLSKDELERFSTVALDCNLTIEIGTRGMAEQTLLQHLELARRFNSSFLRVVVDSKGDEPSPRDVVSRLQPILPRFQDYGVKLAIENHDRFPARTMRNIIEDLGPDHVGICLDTVNSFGALEGPEHVVQVLAPYTLNLHVKDFTITRVNSQMGFVISGCPIGQGRLNVPWLLAELKKAGRDCNAIIELWTPFGNSLDETVDCEGRWADQSVRFMRQLLPD